MSDLAPCKRCGSPAKEQLRSEQPTQWGTLPGGTKEAELEVELNDPDALDDYRVCCTGFPKCPQHVGWNKPTLKLVAAAKARWNEMNEA